jgi:hypothetical protein
VESSPLLISILLKMLPNVNGANIVFSHQRAGILGFVKKPED